MKKIISLLTAALMFSTGAIVCAPVKIFASGDSTITSESFITSKSLQTVKNGEVIENAELKYKLYLPTEYDELRSEPYPVIYLLHGSNSEYKDSEWNSFFPILDKLISDGTIPPMIAVAPVSGNSYWVDSARYGKYEQAINEDLIEHIDNTYNTVSDRTGRMLAGFSLGGYGALRYSLIYPNLYSSCILLSPFVVDGLPPATSGAVERHSFASVGESEGFNEDVWTEKNYPASIQSYAQQSERVKFYILSTDDDWNHLSEKEDLPDDAYNFNTEEQSVRVYTALHRENIFNLDFKKWNDVPANPAELRIINGEHETSPWLIGFENGLKNIYGKEESQELSPVPYDVSNFPSTNKGLVSAPLNITSKELEVYTNPVDNLLEYKIYTPYGYDPNGDKDYPVLYLLHGSKGSASSWDKYWPVLDYMIENGFIDPVIAVAPTDGKSGNKGGKFYWVDSEKFGAYESAIIKDLIPYIDKNYNTISEKSGRALIGYSMGGWGATRYGLTYPEMFAGVTILSPANQDEEAPVTSGAFEEGAFGEPFDESIWNDKNYPSAIIQYGLKDFVVPFYIYAGDDDWNHLSEKEDLPADAWKYNMEVQAVNLYRRLHRQNIFNKYFDKWEDVPSSPAELRIVNGGHDDYLWVNGFQEGIKYMFNNGLSKVLTNVRPTGVTLDKTQLTITQGESYTLKATVIPNNANDKSVIWSSDNNNIATVTESGTIHALSEGTATITVETSTGQFSEKCFISVIPKSSSSGSGGNAPIPPSTSTPATSIPATSVPNLSLTTKATESQIETAKLATKALNAEIVTSVININKISSSQNVAVEKMPLGLKETTYVCLLSDGTIIPVPTYNDTSNKQIYVLASNNGMYFGITNNIAFTDVKQNEWYMTAAQESANMIIVQNTNNEFRPHDPVSMIDVLTTLSRAVGITSNQNSYKNDLGTKNVSRAMAAEIGVSALKAIGIDTTMSDKDVAVYLKPFNDLSDLSTVQKQAFAVCIKFNIFSGNGDGSMTPNNILNRAQMASISMKLHDVALNKIKQ